MTGRFWYLLRESRPVRAAMSCTTGSALPRECADLEMLHDRPISGVCCVKADLLEWQGPAPQADFGVCCGIPDLCVTPNSAPQAVFACCCVVQTAACCSG